MQVGQTASRTLKVTSEHVRLYTEITGDRDPLHYDEDAWASRWGTRERDGVTSSAGAGFVPGHWRGGAAILGVRFQHAPPR
ncbi:MAG: hypothetical protein VX956_11250, partial [Gemmatimonadota bacterium]|nr:hypothetical protein [Gemmatimonadota bacterium]